MLQTLVLPWLAEMKPTAVDCSLHPRTSACLWSLLWPCNYKQTGSKAGRREPERLCCLCIRTKGHGAATPLLGQWRHASAYEQSHTRTSCPLLFMPNVQSPPSSAAIGWMCGQKVTLPGWHCNLARSNCIQKPSYCSTRLCFVSTCHCCGMCSPS